MTGSTTLCAVLIAGMFQAASLAQQPAQQAERIDVRLLSDPRNPWAEPATMIGLLGVVGGILGVMIQRHWHRQDEERAAERAERDRLQAHVLNSLKWFEGKTQKRSIGIAVIEGNWEQFADLQPTWIAVLTNQAVYLLAQSGQADAAHERANLARIMTLLRRRGASVSPEQGVSLVEAIDENRQGAGLRGIASKTLDEWDTFARAI